MSAHFSSGVISLFKRAQATDQGGLLNGKNPVEFSEEHPIRLWIVQVGLIVLTSQLLGLGLRRMKQPKVISEVLSGIILGPTAFGRIPGFTQHIFPEPSIPYLNLVANIGLCLFLFLVGLEIDGAIIKRNMKLSAIVALAGMAIPFGLGAALAVPLYNQFISSDVEFTHFMLFTGVAYSITAFPVLCRILTELKLLDTTVGIVVLSAGVGNDIVGWVLLALSVALVNAGSGLTALYILLVCVGFTLFLLFPVKMALRWVARETGSLENGPTMFFMTVTIILVFGSAFFTDIIGVHAIFGAFIAGLIVPRDGGLSIALTEKLEDMVSIIFLPLYFTLSGLSTDLGLLNDGITWGYTIAILALAFLGKFGGCSLASHYVAGFNWRESSAIGSLILVELIVLNVGLQANILTPKVFSMFVLEALFLTFITTPLVTAIYPPQYRTRAVSSGPNFNNVNDEETPARGPRAGSSDDSLTHFVVVLDKLQHMPGMMSIVQLLQRPEPSPSPRAGSTSPSRKEQRTSVSTHSFHDGSPRLQIDALRLLELSDRTSAVMMSSQHDALLQTDPVLSIFKTFAQLHDIFVKTFLSIVPYDDLSVRVVEHAQAQDSDMIILPWLPSHTSPDTRSPVTGSAPQTPKPTAHSNNPFDALFKSTPVSEEAPASLVHSHFVRSIFSQSKTDVALFVDRAPAGSRVTGSKHLLLPFFGGPDDRLALDFVVRLCANPKVTASIVRMAKEEVSASVASPVLDTSGETKNLPPVSSVVADTVYGHADTHIRLQSESADNIAWIRYTNPQGEDASNPALSRIQFDEISSPTPLHALVSRAEALPKASNLFVVTGRSRRMAVEDHHKEVSALMEEYGVVAAEVRKAIGDVATACMTSGCCSGMIVVQAALSSV